MTRQDLFNQLANHIIAAHLPHPTRVAIDGVDAAGKTTLADELVAPIESRGREVIRASIDRFHRPRAERYARGADSPEGYYYDSFDYAALRAALLDPLGPNDTRAYRRRVFDYRADAPVHDPTRVAAADAILLFDGVFLLRPELAACWDYCIFVHVEFEVALERALARDAKMFGSAENARARYMNRYIPGQRIYLQAVQPQRLADVIVDNNDSTEPRFLFKE
ncbi:MAG: uridine kinase [Chloroflexi bacterium]|nr:uridine kinase [Chloroflexota bacterium]